MRKLILVLLPFALLLGGCPDSEYTDSSGGAIPLERLSDEYARVYCDILERCPPSGGDLALIGLMARNGGDCEGIFRDLIDESGLEDDVAAGKIVYDGAKARECLNGFRDQCSIDDGALRACDETFVGQAAQGENCIQDAHCGIGLWCDTMPADRCEWACTPLPGTGESCAESFECARNGDAEGFCGAEDICRDVAYVRGVGAGQPCTDDDIEDDTVRLCAGGLWCDGGMCSGPVPVGEACPDERALCEGDGFCVQGQCRGVTVLNRAGDDCTPELDDLRFCNTLLELACDEETRKCVDRASGLFAAGEGESCEDSTCSSGLFCDYTTDTPVCSGPKDDGEACEFWDDECKSGYCSDAGQCEPLPVCQ